MAGQEKARSQYFWKLNLKEFTKIWCDEKFTKNPKSGLPEKTTDLSEFKQLNVLAYILQNVHPSDNTFSLTYKEIAEKTDVSQDTVVRIMRRLSQKKFIRKLHNGAYIVNPYVLVWGPEGKRDMIYRDQYSKAKELRQPAKKKLDDSSK